MANGRINDFYKQYEQLMIKFEKQEQLLKETNKLVSNLNNTIKTLNNTINSLKKVNEEQAKEILRLKDKNNKNSSNSSKPSSTNNFKKVVTNRREKSNKFKGGQKGHKPHSLNNKLKQFINSGNILEELIEINKNVSNQNKKYIEKVVIDIKITKHIKRYRYYPYKDGKYYIPKNHNQYVQYGNNVKAISIDLMNNLYNSTDGVVRFISDITNNGITLSKGTLINWNNELSTKLSSELENIKSNLLDSYFINHDESQIKINGAGYNVLCACNKNHVRLWQHKHKSQEALDEIGFLPKYHGVIVKDGTELYNKYGTFLSQCLSHIQRYLKGIYDFVSHKSPKKLSDFFTKYNSLRNDYINKEINSFKDEEYNKIISEYDSIINEWEKELKEDTTNHLFNEEFKLFTRLKYDNKKMNNKIRGDRDEILYFLKDFNVPSTNNNAESSQRGVKIKQKIGKFRSENGAESYLNIKSCILTYKKQSIDILNTLTSAFDGNVVIA
ncbi:MAG: transposase [Bacilli bacterium]